MRMPAHAAAVVVALVLLATVVTGREQSPPQLVAAIAPVPVAERAELRLPVRARDETMLTDLFAGAVPERPPVPATPVHQQVPAAPSAPPLPFRYIGRMTKADRHYVYLAKGEDVLVAESGQMLEATYRVESITPSAVQVIYLPLGTVQTVAIPANP